jgi:hypothetical protein
MPLTQIEIEGHIAADARRLTGQPWHTLNPSDTAKAIELQHVWRVIGPAVRDYENLPGVCQVGTVTQHIDA